jgi:hypothetical protein
MLQKDESISEFAQDHESGLRSERGPVTLCDFFEVAILDSLYDFLSCMVDQPIQPTIQARE